MKIETRCVNELPSDIKSQWLEAAVREGFAPMQWRIEDWLDGKNRFSLPGEALYEARIAERLVGVCGMDQDPHAECKSKPGHIRRLFVLPAFRRLGVSTKLVLRAVEGRVLILPR